MTRRHYSNTATQQTTTASMTSSDVSLTISDTFAGWPTLFPFYATISIGKADMEIVSVTAISGTTATIARGQGGTSAIGHLAGVTFDFTIVAEDVDEPNAHIATDSGVHGVAGALVGTTDTQTLTNKTLTSPTVNDGSITGAAISGGTVSGAAITTSSVAGTNVSASGTLTSAGAATLASLGVTGNETVGGSLTVTGALTIPQPTWTPLTLNAGMSTYAGYFVPAYTIHPDGCIELRGAVAPASSGTFVAGSNLLLTLPTIIRPTAFVVQAASFTGYSTSYTIAPLLLINTSGTIVFYWGYAVAGGCSLDGIRYYLT